MLRVAGVGGRAGVRGVSAGALEVCSVLGSGTVSLPRVDAGLTRHPGAAIPVVHGLGPSLNTHVAGVRFFWWGDRDDGDDDGKGGKGGKGEKGKGSKSKDPEAPDSESPGAGDADSDEKADHERIVQILGGDDTAVTQLGQGDKAPRPPQVLAIPLPRRPLFPGFMLPLNLTDQNLQEVLINQKKNDRPYIGAFMLKDSSIEEPFAITDVDDIHRVGVLAHIQHLAPVPGGLQAMLMAHRRIRITDVITHEPSLTVQVHHIDSPELTEQSSVVKAYCNEILSTIREIIHLNPMFKEHIQYFTQRLDVHDAYRLADFAASLTTGAGSELQGVLEAVNVEDRLSRALVLLKQERELSKLQQEIQKEVESRMSENQRKYFLTEQLRSIKKELGMEKDDKDALLIKFRERLEDKVVPEAVSTIIEDEFQKLEMLERNSAEFNVTRAYLDWLTCLPWGVFSADTFDIKAAENILTVDHYGMKDVKDRVLEFIAVGRLQGSVQGKIMCLVGPPGVGKTSIGKSIAKSIGREFYRFSVGGLSDVAEIKGHRRTYIGAMPGKLIQCLKSTNVSNPLVLIDEIDKLGRGHTGDPASALLEMLDPNQNESFMDHYLDAPVDASKVLFLCTANTLDTIPGPLLDRMEVVEVSGYDSAEKMEIARQYLEPKARKESGLPSDRDLVPDSMKIDDEAIESLIRWYARESGVRNLEKLINKIYRKLALKLVRAYADADLPWPGDAPAEGAAETKADGAEEGVEDPVIVSATPTLIDHTGRVISSGPEPIDRKPVKTTGTSGPGGSAESTQGPAAERILIEDDGTWTVTLDNLEDFVGKPIFTTDRMFEETPPGVIMGLAYTSMGGAALYIESMSADPRVREGNRLSEPDPDSEGSDKDAAPTPGLKLTGKLGEVMQESAQIAHTYARKAVQKLEPGNRYLDTVPVHIHVPEGATPKDGPSAGVTIVTSLLSLATNTPIAPNLAMTGEVTLSGRVLPVGGIKEKTMAARRSGVTTLIFPEGCRKDFEELADHLKEGLDVHYAKTYADVAKVAFGVEVDLDRE